MASDHDIIQALSGRALPIAWLDHERLEHNIDVLSKLASPLKIRVASKSVRSSDVLRILLHEHPHIFHGILAYHPDEAVWLSSLGFKDIVIGYPYMDWFSHQEGLKSSLDEITFMVDRIEHLEVINQFGAKRQQKINICFDIDLSTKHFGVLFGVYRSSLRSEVEMTKLLDHLEHMKFVHLRGIMGYEAQIAGVGDANPFKKLLNPVISFLKKKSWPIVKNRRQSLVKLCISRGFKLDFVNGGGTGSLALTKSDESVTEVAAGSGIYSPLLFDYYKSFKLLPAAGFALEVTRMPARKTVTVAGGGYIASGANSPDKSPRPMHSQHLSLEANEGAGEVQTPLHGKVLPKLGSMVLFRHAKAGELCERFNHLHLVKLGEVSQLKTYRGEGKCFL
tara:strand:+ start:4772 stop:5947 length:1176 start_codon:yes stop_codon:yes gene_type:complete